MSQASFHEVQEKDWPGVLEIYNHYIATSTANFRLAPLDKEGIQTFLYTNHPLYKTFAIDLDGELAGMCFLTQFRAQEAYDRTAEMGVYLRPGFTRRGLGTQATRHLERVAAAVGVKTLIASVCGENAPSIALFGKLGYEKCAHFRRVGEKFGRVLDVVYFQTSIDDGDGSAAGE